MSAAAEIERLASLLDRGLITRDEFDTQKSKLLTAEVPSAEPEIKKKDNSSGWTIFAIIVVIFLIMFRFAACSSSNDVASVVNQFTVNPPINKTKCNDALVLDTLKAAVKNIPFANVVGISVISVSNIEQVRRNDSELYCSATVMLSNTSSKTAKYKAYSDGSQLVVHTTLE